MLTPQSESIKLTIKSICIFNQNYQSVENTPGLCIEKTKTGCKCFAKPINTCDVMIIRFILNVINHNDICFVHRCPKRSAPGPHDSPLSEILAFCLEIGIRHPSFVWLWLWTCFTGPCLIWGIWKFSFSLSPFSNISSDAQFSFIPKLASLWLREQPQAVQRALQ